MSKVYTSIMRRWGSRETHSYLLGAFSSYELALKTSHEEEDNRGGKYKAEIIESAIDVVISDTAFAKKSSSDTLEKVTNEILSLPKEEFIKKLETTRDACGFFADVYTQMIVGDK